MRMEIRRWMSRRRVNFGTGIYVISLVKGMEIHERAHNL